MIKRKFTILFAVVNLHGYCFTAETENCSLEDSECLTNYFQNVARTYAADGIPEIGISPLDPFHMEDVNVPAILWYLTLVAGDCLGIGNCTLLNYESNLENFERTVEVICDRIVIQGSYEIRSYPIFCLFFGNAHGCGNGTIVLEDWYFQIIYPFGFVKHDDGLIYTQADFKEAKWVSKILKNVIITADNIMLNNRDVTKHVLRYINKYWRMIFETFGKSFHEISVGYYFEVYEQFFNNTPAANYLSDDLTQYLKNDLECSQ